MKYFGKEFTVADNNSSLSRRRREEIHKQFLKNCKAYRNQLAKLRPRLSKQAWIFFFGFRRWGLHDARLLNFSVGDGLDYRANGKQPFEINNRRAKVQIRVLNRLQNLLYTFTCGGVRKVEFDYPSDEPLFNWGRIDLLNTYELTAADKRYLRLEFQFTSGATALVECIRIKFSRERIRRRYSI
jgi:hypothetical protein